MHNLFDNFWKIYSVFMIGYMFLYSSYLFFAVLVGAWQLYQRSYMQQIREKLKHSYHAPVSVLVPAYNEEVTIVESVSSLLNLQYDCFEIIVIDDGSKDQTAQKLIEAFEMKETKRNVEEKIPSKPLVAVYEKKIRGIDLILIKKVNGGKGDALNMGINVSRYPYFLCLDADSMLQKDSLEKIIQPVMDDENVVAVGGAVRVAQCVKMKDGEVLSYHLPKNWVESLQAVEYERSYLASRILMDQFNGNLIISGAFSLFRKDMVISVGGYDTSTLGEDMELVVKLHTFCRNNDRPYSIKYEPDAVCWSQAPSTMSDLKKQRRRWYLGLFQCMTKYYRIFANARFGLISLISYMYYLLFELLSPVIEVLGLTGMLAAFLAGSLNGKILIEFFLLYSLYGVILTITSFFQKSYTKQEYVNVSDLLKAVWMCILENFFFRYVLSFVRMTAFIGYKNRKKQWGQIQRVKMK